MIMYGNGELTNDGKGPQSPSTFAGPSSLSLRASLFGNFVKNCYPPEYKSYVPGLSEKYAHDKANEGHLNHQKRRDLAGRLGQAS